VLLWRHFLILAAMDALTTVAAYLGHMWLRGADTGPLSSDMALTTQGLSPVVLARARDSKRRERRSSERQNDLVMLFGVDCCCGIATDMRR
jgi:hypothetical protein